MHEPAENDDTAGHEKKKFQSIAKNVAAVVVLDEGQKNGNDQGEEQHGEYVAFEDHGFLPLAMSKAFSATR
jgi:hypothetical protein